MIPRNYEGQTLTDDELQKIKDICSKSSHVNGWYEHQYEDGNIRGPWNRWVNVTEGSEDGVEQGYIAKKENDVTFIATAMNNLERLVDEVIRLRAATKLAE